MMRVIPLIVVAMSLAACGTRSKDTDTDSDTELPDDVVASDRSERPFTVDVGDLVLEGTLTLPEHQDGELLPAIVLVHGTGPQSRDELTSGQNGLSFSFEFPVFAELSDLLVDRGYAVLRYDKRSCAADQGCDNSYGAFGAATVVDFIADGAMVADALRDESGIDPDRVAVLGHSQGGAMMPAMLAASPDTAAGIALAGPWSDIATVAKWQYDTARERFLELGATEAEIDAEIGEVLALSEALNTLAEDDIWTGQAWGAEDYWRDWMAMDAARPGFAAAAGRPMLALSGDYDWNVGTAETLAWKQAGVADAQILPGITHVMNLIENPDYATLTQDEIGRGVDVSVSDAIADYLDDAMP